MGTITPVEPAPEPRRETFKEARLKGEPASDVKVTAGGLMLRERVKRLQSGRNIAFIFTYTRLDAAGQVMLDEHGNPIVSDPHEIAVDGESATRAGPDGLAEAIKQGREVAVARAVDQFRGLEQLSGLFVGRIA